jgi:hypothetical protein
MFLGKTPLEAKLERENERLKAELEYYKHLETPEFSIMEEPKIVQRRLDGDTLRIAVRGGIELDALRNQYHVYVVDTSQPEHFKVGYYISSLELLHNRDRAQLMQHIMEQAVRQIEKIL